MLFQAMTSHETRVYDVSQHQGAQKDYLSLGEVLRFSTMVGAM